MLKMIRLLIALVAFAPFAGVAFAGEQPFNQAQFDQLNAAGKPSIVYFHATWCPTCKVQQPIVDKLSAQPDRAGVPVFIADFDKEVALKRAMKVSQQSTFVVFKGGHEVTRSTGQTSEQAITDVFNKAL
jgi:thioredoxin 1